jgi:hypothetical protein
MRIIVLDATERARLDLYHRLDIVNKTKWIRFARRTGREAEQPWRHVGSGSITSIALGLLQSTPAGLDASGIGEAKLSGRKEESFMFHRIVKVVCALAVALATMLATVPATALPANAHTGSHPSGTRSLAELLATDSSGFDTNWSDYTSSTTPSGPC